MMQDVQLEMTREEMENFQEILEYVSGLPHYHNFRWMQDSCQASMLLNKVAKKLVDPKKKFKMKLDPVEYIGLFHILCRYEQREASLPIDQQTIKNFIHQKLI